MIASIRSARCTWVQLTVAAVIALLALSGCGKGGSSAASGSAGTSTRAQSQSTAALAPSSPTTSLSTVEVSDLPSQAVQTLNLIEQGGPYPYSKDGVTFGNREGILPKKPNGFYQEYTVKKPGESDRGPWRIVTGKDGSRFWTDDHYASFQEVIAP